ncbi:ATP synthase subunit I [uncultured Sulfitobacter sp.]|uniref:N-ATPase subunit AtpR n=1 Tax=uncultured Sulfitobacter sp. TaxID=191468 RepID=UPI00260B89C3|nr:ATP synthase subunit I [uncultured Sulfitobacter sp.]
MTEVDWAAVAGGLAIGAVLSVLFFAGLKVGMRLALRTRTPVGFLALSAALRIAVLLAAGWGVVQQGGVWAFAGFALAFLVVRMGAITLVRAGDAP